MKKKKKGLIKAEEFDKIFDEGKESIIKYLDLKNARVVRPVQRINIDMPAEILERVDKEAGRVGVPRTSLLKLWIAQHLDQLASRTQAK